MGTELYKKYTGTTTVDTATQKFSLTATGEAATTYIWITEINQLRNA